ncbi:pilin [Patescibacteria group bacterium]|nr:pilin [Patescibacteria group bacterium]
MFNKKYLKLFLCFCVLVFLCFGVLSANFCLAQILPAPSDDGACPEGENCGGYTLDDFVKIFTNYYSRILGIIGSIALLMFIYGGIMFLVSAGSSEKVQQAKQIIIGAVIGLVIVFASYTIIQFVFTALEIPNAGNGGWATVNWFKK